MVYARVELDDYTNRVLNVLKAKYGLRDKGQAIDKMANLYGGELVERQASEAYAREMEKGYQKDVKKHGYKGIRVAEQNKLCGM